MSGKRPHPANTSIPLDSSTVAVGSSGGNEGAKCAMTHKMLAKDFAASTTAHGLQKIIESRHILLTLFWTLISMTAIGLSLWQSSNLIKQFIAREVNIRIEVITAKRLVFPAVSLCNTNKLRKSAIENSEYSDLVAIDTKSFRPYYGWFSCNDSIEMTPMLNKCDGYSDCSDGSDEDESTCEGLIFTCVNESRKINIIRKCDTFKDCTDGSDESGCEGDVALTPPTELFSCDNGEEKINISYKCDGYIDCSDGSDEDLIICEGSNAHYSPTLEGVLRFYPNLRGEDALFEDFLEEHYRDHMFGRVLTEDPPDWDGFIAYSKTMDNSDLREVLKLTKDEVKTLGHQIEDFILDCTFDEGSCNTRDFRTYQDDEYGNCFEFNHLQGNNTTIYTTKPGSKYGLKVVLYTEQNEYISLFGQNSGARIVLKTHGDPAIPAREGFTVSPGTISSVGIRQREIRRKSYPYGDCRTEETFQSIYGEKYSKMICEETCVQTKMYEHCGCVDTMLANGTRCMLLNREQDVCKQLTYYLFSRDKLDCDCKQACEGKWFDFTISQSLWPSDTYFKHFIKQIHQKNNRTRILNDFESVSKNFLKLEVFYHELDYESIEEVPALTEESLLSDIGGTLGLYCGISFITMVEFLQFFVELMHLTYMKYVHRRLTPTIRRN